MNALTLPETLNDGPMPSISGTLNIMYLNVDLLKKLFECEFMYKWPPSPHELAVEEIDPLVDRCW